MGATVTSLHFLGVPLEDVQAALPYTLAGKWSERFVTACPDLSPRTAERKAASLSAQLSCTVLLVSMFDGDALWLTLFQNGKRITGHTALPEHCTAGNVKLFCAALGLPEELVPKLKRLFTGCNSQEEKLGILQELLGVPLFLRWDSQNHLPAEPFQANAEPLETWLREHPIAPKVKNQCKAELIQEISGLYFYQDTSNEWCLLNPRRLASEVTAVQYGSDGEASELTGICGSAGALGRILPDGRLELTPLEEPPVSNSLMEQLFGGSDYGLDRYVYAALGSRTVTAAVFFVRDGVQAYSPAQSVILQDSAGILPCPLPLALDDGPVIADKLWLLPDGGFLAHAEPRPNPDCRRLTEREAMLVRCGADGGVRYFADSEAGLQEDDRSSLRAVYASKRRISCADPVLDSQNRLWSYREKHFECSSPEQKIISRHRPPGDAVALYCNDSGQACAITQQFQKGIIRVYRFL